MGEKGKVPTLKLRQPKEPSLLEKATKVAGGRRDRRGMKIKSRYSNNRVN
jgi:hypothetical protein